MKALPSSRKIASKAALFLLLLLFASLIYLKFFRPFTEESSIGFRTILNPGTQLGIAARPFSNAIIRGTISELPVYDPKLDKPFQIDLRGTDVTGIDTKRNLESMFLADFDDQTRWPSKLPDDFSPSVFMELGKNPGLGIRQLHAQGITGKDVGLAIIDRSLLVDHLEYQKSLRLYEEMHNFEDSASFHGPAVASIAVGKSIGVAPDADLYFIAESHGQQTRRGVKVDLAYLAQAIERILEINRALPKEKKIRVLSISVRWGHQSKGYSRVVSVVKKAIAEGIFVVSAAIDDSYGPKFKLGGLGRLPNLDPEQSTSYSPGFFYLNWLKNGHPLTIDGNTLWAPMDSRCTASPGGNENYAFYRIGGISWSVPYVAGLYALACQVAPNITPEIFWKKALLSGDPLDYDFEGKKINFGKIVNPARLLSAIKY